MSQAQALTTRMAGPAQQTVVERFVGRLPLPYVPASLLLAALLGPPGYVLFRYFDAGSFTGALTGYFAGMVPAATWQQVAAIPTWPIDTGMIRRLAAVVASIIVAIVTHSILALLQFS